MLLLRLLARWRQHPESTAPSAAWRRLEAGYHRSRARLRGAASRQRARCIDALVVASAPYARLLAGVRRYAIAHFWKEAHLNFPGTASAAPRAPQPLPAPSSALWPDPETQGTVRAWLLLAVLRGLGPTVAAWRDRRVGRVAGSWDRLLGELKAALGEPQGPTSPELRARLSLALYGTEDTLGLQGEPGPALMPALEQVAALDENGRKTIEHVRAILREVAAPGQGPEPKGGSPAMVREARRWIRPPGSALT